MTRRLRELDPAAHGILAALTMAALLLRIWVLHGRAPQGDDVGTLYYTRESYGFLLTHFRDPWLAMNAYMAFAKAIHDAFGAGAVAIPSLVAGTALVPLVAACTLRVAPGPAALAAAAFVAGNPYLVEQSVELRAYALFECASIAALAATLDWAARPSAGPGLRAGAWTTIAVLLHANGVYLVAPLALLAVAPAGQTLAPAIERRSAARTLLLPALAGGAVLAAAYLPLRHEMAEVRRGWADTPPTSLAWVPAALSEYFGAGLLVLPFATLLGIGALASIRGRSPAQAVLAVVVLVIAEIAFSGLSHFPWGHARMASFLLPMLLLVAGAGAAAAAPAPASRALIVLVALATGVPGLAELDARKRDYPWALVAEAVRPHATGRDPIVELDSGQELPLHHLRPFLGDAAVESPPLADLVRSDPATVRSLAVVNPHEPVVTSATSATQRTFGKVQVIEYGPLPTRALAEALVADLERSVGDGPTPGRTGLFLTLLGLRRALGRKDDDGRLTQAYYECLARTRRQRFQPPQKMPPVER